ncbi:MAG TPA: histidinol-phosphate transaminase [Candidatus Thermoplasmatota archaeon]|nr:histidinol-phosphate transaminase [Candidatus Thermoplasmatota archaeon]
MTKGPADLARAVVRATEAYEEEAPKGGLNLMNNANLWGANPAIAKAIARLRPDAFWDYPDNASGTLRRALARHHEVDPASIVLGNGSNEMIDALARAFVEDGETVAHHAPIFSMIPTFARLAGAKTVAVPLGPRFALDAPALARAAQGAKVTFVCRPNNPTGNAFPRPEVERVVSAAGGLVVVDEAYAEFGPSSFLPEVARNPRLVVLRTFSKAYGLAGFRVGYAVAHPDVAREIAKVRGPFKLNTASELVAAMALEERAWVENVVEGVRVERARLSRALADLKFDVFPSDANFVLVKPPVDAHGLAAALRERGVYVRDFAGPLAAYLRVTVAPPAASERLLAALREILGAGA